MVLMCNIVSKQALSLIKNLIEKGYINGKMLDFGGIQNFYRTPDVTGLSLVYLFVSEIDDPNLILVFPKITHSPNLSAWLRAVKVFSEH
jgi:hypothetical protein